MRRAYPVTKPDKMLREHKLRPCEMDTINHSILEMKRLRAKEIQNWSKNTEVKIGRAT